MERVQSQNPPRELHAVGQREEQTATASLHIPLPGPSIWPLLLGAAVATFVIGLLFIDSYPWLSLITLPLVLTGILGWVLEKPATQPALASQVEAAPAMATAPLADVEIPTLKLGTVSIPAPPTNAGARILADVPTLKLGSASMAGPSLASSGQFKWGKPTPLPPGPAVTPLPALSPYTPYTQAQPVPPQTPHWGQQHLFPSTPLPQPPLAQLSMPPSQQRNQQQRYRKRGMKRSMMIAVLCSIAIVVLVIGYSLTTIVNHKNTSQPAPPAQSIAITVTNAGFSPGSITIKAGTPVIWTNKSTLPHTVTDSGVFDSGNLPVGSSYRLALTHPGTYHYVCSYHPFMVGTIIVQQT